jgi:hypothetical protein
MPRPRLSPEEREQRRKERIRHSFSDAAYRHYNPETEGYGSTEEWIRAAEALASGCGILNIRSSGTHNPDLLMLNLEALPNDISGLKRAFHNSLFIHHPDYGGTNEACREALAAFERLKRHYQ